MCANCFAFLILDSLTLRANTKIKALTSPLSQLRSTQLLCSITKFRNDNNFYVMKKSTPSLIVTKNKWSKPISNIRTLCNQKRCGNLSDSVWCTHNILSIRMLPHFFLSHLDSELNLTKILNCLLQWLGRKWQSNREN